MSSQLVRTYYYFGLAGGSLSLEEWLSLNDEHRAAAVQAGRKLRAEKAIDIATALSGPLGPEALRAQFDGGESYDEALIEAAVAEVARGV